MTDELLTSLVDRIVLLSQTEADSGDQVRVWTIVVSTPPQVLHTIRRLHALGYAEVGLWSPAQAIPGTEYVITMHTRRAGREPDIIDRAGR